MEAVLPLAGFGFALGWPLEWVIQRFPQGVGTAPSSRRRWIVAGITALLFALEALSIGIVPELLPALLLTALVVPAAAIDLEHRIIPNRIVLPATALVLVANMARDLSPEWALAALAGSGFLFAAALVYPAGMGMGDVKLALFMGAALGRTVSVALMVGMLAAMIPGIYLLARHGSKARKMGIPFGPFLALGSVVALFWGDDILHAYLSTLH